MATPWFEVFMSPIEWLQFITPFVLVVSAIALVASIPLTQHWCNHYKLPKRRLAFIKTEILMFVVIIIGWLLAWLAPTFITPVVRVNTQATSELLLTIALSILGLIVIIRIFQKNNLLSLWLVLLKRQLPFIAEVATPIIAVVSLIIIESFAETCERQYKESQKDDPCKTDLEKATLGHGMDLNGDYCGQSKSLWYGNSNKK